MKTRAMISMSTVFSFILLSLAVPALSPAGEYQALKGVKSVKILFDFRDGNLKSAPVHLKLIHKTYKDKALTAITAKPKFVVVFMGNAVKLLSKSRKGVSAEEAKVRDEIAGLIAAMSKAGIKIEACLFAVKFFGGDPKDLVPGIDHVPNGWISAFGYQAKGYALIPAY